MVRELGRDPEECKDSFCIDFWGADMLKRKKGDLQVMRVTSKISLLPTPQHEADEDEHFA